MPKGVRKGGPGRAYRTEPFFVAIRNAERRILRSALDEFKTMRAAADAMGITENHFATRSIQLGGVLPNQPAREPPGNIHLARDNARGDGVNIPAKPGPSRRRGKIVDRRKNFSVRNSNSNDPLPGVRADPAGPQGSGAGSSGAAQANLVDESGSERSVARDDLEVDAGDRALRGVDVAAGIDEGMADQESARDRSADADAPLRDDGSSGAGEDVGGVRTGMREVRDETSWIDGLDQPRDVDADLGSSGLVAPLDVDP
jgi:hypothetical protein